jgi:hypothetical protein
MKGRGFIVERFITRGATGMLHGKFLHDKSLNYGREDKLPS